HEAGARLYQRTLFLFLELRTPGRSAAILPDNRAMDGPARGALPGAHRLALVRDADGVGRNSRLFDGFARGVDGDAQDLLGVVLDLSRRREVLGEFAVTPAEDAAVGAQDERGGAGGALIEGEDSRHWSDSPPENGG